MTNKQQINAIAHLSNWNAKNLELVQAREAYRAAFASAFSKSEAKTADGKKNEADVATSALRLQRDLLEAEVLYLWELFQIEKQGEAA